MCNETPGGSRRPPINGGGNCRTEEEKAMSKNNWKVGLRAKLEHLVDDCVVAGARQQDVFDAIIKEIGNLRAALERDPDPADDEVIEEPSNDWPAADR